MRHRDDENRAPTPAQQLEGLPLLDGHVGRMARAADPGTSKDAAALTLCSVVWQRAEIVRALQYAWARGFTAPEIADFLNRDTLPVGWAWTQEIVSRRIHEVRAAGDCVTYDNRRRPGIPTYPRVDRDGCAIHVFARQHEPVAELAEQRRAS